MNDEEGMGLLSRSLVMMVRNDLIELSMRAAVDFKECC